MERDHRTDESSSRGLLRDGGVDLGVNRVHSGPPFHPVVTLFHNPKFWVGFKSGFTSFYGTESPIADFLVGSLEGRRMKHHSAWFASKTMFMEGMRAAHTLSTMSLSSPALSK